MAVRGWVTGCKLVNQGSELTADVIAGATSLPVDWVGDFDDTGGTGLINGAELDYTTVDEDADTVTLATPLPADAAEGDRVDVISGGQVLKDYTLFVTLGDGDDVEVDISYGDRDAWPEGDYDDPVEVLLSDDLTSIEKVPGVSPVRRIIGGYIGTSDDEDAPRIVVRDDDSGGIIEFFRGLDDEIPGILNPTTLGSTQPGVTLNSGEAGAYDVACEIRLYAGNTVLGLESQLTLDADNVYTAGDLLISNVLYVDTVRAYLGAGIGFGGADLLNVGSISGGPTISGGVTLNGGITLGNNSVDWGSWGSVSRGAADSGGPGLRALCVAN